MITFDAVTKYYPTTNGRKYILKDVTLSIGEDVNVGVLGLNGAGKSTLIRLIGGVDFPSQGNISVQGSVSWPLGLAGGMQGSLTGRENATFVCRVHGDNHETIERKLAYMNEFAELGVYFEMPVKTYSSGMRARFMFALSMAFDFDIYLIDEITAVGDARFREKSKNALRERRETSKYIMVSHNLNDLIRECDKLLVLNEGSLQLFDHIDDGISFYQEIVASNRLQVNK